MQRRYRLRQSHDFVRVRNIGRAYRHAWLILSVAPNEHPHNRYGVITSKRIGKAVTRNRVRRQLREAARLSHPHLHSSYDIVLIAKPAIVGQPFAAIQRTLNKLYQRAGLVQPAQPGPDQL
jgi:ribonuclease P protein component